MQAVLTDINGTPSSSYALLTLPKILKSTHIEYVVYCNCNVSF